MQWLAELCVKRPVFASVLILSLTVVGIFSFLRLGVDRFPKIDLPTVLITTVQPGAAPEQIETEVTDKIEEAVNTISGIDELRSSSSEGVSQVIISFLLDKDIDVAAQEVRDKINGVLPQLPRTIEQPRVDRMDPDAAPVLSLALTANRPVREITEYADKVLRRQLESLNGVGQVVVNGGRERQINIRLDADRLRAYNVTVTEVARALGSQNAEIPGGRMDQGASSVTLRTRGRVQSVEEFGDIIVKASQAHAVRIADVAEVEDGMADADTVANINGTSTVLLNIRRQSGTNTVEVVNGIKEQLKATTGALPPGYNLRIVRDGAEFIEASIHNVEEHLVVGSLLAAFVVMLFLMNLRSTIIAAIAIPTSIIATFSLIGYMGFTLNMMTMLALTLSVGIVIDDAIVVLENIYRFIEEKHDDQFQAAIDAHQGDRPRRAGDHAVARGHFRAGWLHGRHRRQVHEELRPDDGVRDHGVAPRELHADADAVGSVAEGQQAREGRPLVEAVEGLPRGGCDLHADARMGDGAPGRRGGPGRGRAVLEHPVVHDGGQELHEQRRPV